MSGINPGDEYPDMPDADPLAGLDPKEAATCLDLLILALRRGGDIVTKAGLGQAELPLAEVMRIGSVAIGVDAGEQAGAGDFRGVLVTLGGVEAAELILAEDPGSFREIVDGAFDQTMMDGL